MTKHEVLQKLMDRLHTGEDPKEVLFDLLLELDEWFSASSAPQATLTERQVRAAVNRHLEEGDKYAHCGNLTDSLNAALAAPQSQTPCNVDYGSYDSILMAANAIVQAWPRLHPDSEKRSEIRKILRPFFPTVSRAQETCDKTTGHGHECPRPSGHDGACGPIREGDFGLAAPADPAPAGLGEALKGER